MIYFQAIKQELEEMVASPATADHHHYSDTDSATKVVYLVYFTPSVPSVQTLTVVNAIDAVFIIIIGI